MCRTIDGTASHHCEAPARVSATDHDALERHVVQEAKRIAAGVYAETDETQAMERAQRDIAEADKLLDELDSLDVRDSLGPRRWAKLIKEAGDRRGRAAEALQATRHQAGGDKRRVWMAYEFDSLEGWTTWEAAV